MTIDINLQTAKNNILVSQFYIRQYIILYSCDVFIDQNSFTSCFSENSFLRSSKFTLLVTLFTIYINENVISHSWQRQNHRHCLIIFIFQKDLSADATVPRAIKRIL